MPSEATAILPRCARTREGIVVDCVLQKDVSFKSSSTAGNFVTGRSTNGPAVWKDENGTTIKEIISKSEE
ncbi:MAG: DUF4357 domain-containing protein [Clostridia bacterium]|nr:DUF4357 domain-containing protein [Clostridia bacterium]